MCASLRLVFPFGILSAIFEAEFDRPVYSGQTDRKEEFSRKAPLSGRARERAPRLIECDESSDKTRFKFIS